MTSRATQPSRPRNLPRRPSRLAPGDVEQWEEIHAPELRAPPGAARHHGRHGRRRPRGRPRGGRPSDGDHTRQVRAAVKGGHATNVIFMLGDGMGDSEITSARYYPVGAAGLLPGSTRCRSRRGHDVLPHRGRATAHGKPNYVPDSAATGTAWSTGFKTSNGASPRPSTTGAADDPRAAPRRRLRHRQRVDGRDHRRDAGGARPHVNDRGCQGPADMANCPQYAKPAAAPARSPSRRRPRVDVVLGGGEGALRSRRRPAARTPARPSSSQAAGAGYRFVDDAAGLPRSPTQTKRARALQPGQHDARVEAARRPRRPAARRSATDDTAERPAEPSLRT